MRVEVINTGSELLLGQVINTNVSHLGQKLLSLGLKIERQTAVPDGGIIKTILAEAIKRSDIIIITGGLGPTPDDISKEMTAELLALELEEVFNISAEFWVTMQAKWDLKVARDKAA